MSDEINKILRLCVFETSTIFVFNIDSFSYYQIKCDDARMEIKRVIYNILLMKH